MVTDGHGLQVIADDLEDHRVIDDTAEKTRTGTAAKRNDIRNRVESCFCVDGSRFALFPPT